MFKERYGHVNVPAAFEFTSPEDEDEDDEDWFRSWASRRELSDDFDPVREGRARERARERGGRGGREGGEGGGREGGGGGGGEREGGGGGGRVGLPASGLT